MRYCTCCMFCFASLTGGGLGSSSVYGNSSSGSISDCSPGGSTSGEEVLSWRRGVDSTGAQAVSQAWSPVRFLQQLSCLLVPTYVAAAN